MSRNHIYRSASELVGSTPLMEMRNMEREEGLQAVASRKAGVSESRRQCKGQNCQKHAGYRGSGRALARTRFS